LVGEIFEDPADAADIRPLPDVPRHCEGSVYSIW